MAIMPVISKQARRNVKVEKLVEQARKALQTCVEAPGTTIPETPSSQRRKVGTRRLERSQIAAIEKLLEVVESNFTVENGETSKTSKHMVVLLLAHDIPLQLLESLPCVDNGTRGWISKVLCLLFQSGYSDLSRALTEYMKLRAKDLFATLRELYQQEEFVGCVGPVLRICMSRKERFFVHKSLKQDTGFIETIATVNMASKSRQVVEDGYETLTALLLPVSSDARIPSFLVEDYERLCNVWNAVLSKGSEVAQNCMLDLLRELLFERNNYEFRCKYVSDGVNFEALWSLFSTGCGSFIAKSRATLKLFVANPHKSPEMELLLAQRKGHLIQVVAQTCDRKSRASLNESNELISSLHQLDCCNGNN